MKKLFGGLFIAAGLFAASIFSATPAAAQACQWNYSLVPKDPAGAALASYCNNVLVEGDLTVDGTIHGGPTNTVDTVAQLSAVATPAAGAVYFVKGYHAAGDWGGGTFIFQTAVVTPDSCVNFAASITGTWVRQLNGGPLAVEMCGAYHDNTNGAATVTAFQKAFDWMAANRPNGIITAYGPDYATDNATTVVKADSFNCPRLEGGSEITTNYHFKPASDANAFLFVGGSGAVCKGGITGIAFDGNSHTIPVEIRDLGGMYHNYRVIAAKQGMLMTSFASGGFAEHNCFVARIDDLQNTGTILEYKTVSGTGSFKESGLCVGSMVSAASGGSGSLVVIDAGSQPYNFPLDIDVIAQAGNWNLVNNASANFPNTYGNIRVELDGTAKLILAESGNVIFPYGNIAKQIGSSAQLINKYALFGAVNGTQGGHSGFNPLQNGYVLGENASSVLQYLAAGTGATTVLNELYSPARSRQYHITIAGPYDWDGIVTVLNNTGASYSICATCVVGNLFAGTSAPTFAINGAGKLQMTVADAITASTNAIYWFEEIPNNPGY